MDNSIIKKLVTKINFDLAEKFELALVRELSFVPINVQSNTFFIAIYSNSNKEKIAQYASSLIEYKTEFIYLTKDNFESLLAAFIKMYKSKFSDGQNSAEDNSSLESDDMFDDDFEEDEDDEAELELGDDDDFNLDDDVDLSDDEDDSKDMELVEEEDYFSDDEKKPAQPSQASAMDIVEDKEEDKKDNSMPSTIMPELKPQKPLVQEPAPISSDKDDEELEDEIGADEDLEIDEEEVELDDEADDFEIEDEDDDEEIKKEPKQEAKAPVPMPQSVKNKPETAVNSDEENEIIELTDDDDVEFDFDLDAEVENDNSEDEHDEHEYDAELEEDLDAEFDILAPNQEEDEEEEVDPDGVATVDVSKVKAPQTKKLGEILLEVNLINEKQLEIALAESKVQNIPLGSILVKMGFVKIKDLKEVLGAQMGLSYATADQLKALPTAISILPEDFVKINKVIPLSMTDTSLVVGMVNPSDKKVINEIIYQTGLKPTVMLVTHVEFENFINTYYNTDKSETDELLEQINEDQEMEGTGGELWQQVEDEVKQSDGAVSQLANKIITMAISRRASDIHIEPMAAGYRVRLRVDGSLEEAIKIPPKVDSAVISRFKVLSKMNIAEHRRAQDGSFTMKYKNHAQDFRVNTLPVAGREKMVIRVLAPQMDAKQAKADVIDIVGASEDDVKKIRYLVSCPNGIVLTSGPTGSGKTTTLYSILRYLNSDSVNITTIEDPIEIKLEGINQSAINTKAGITFANSLRAILRQDPDVILVGEIRDFETLEVAISASLTGHLVLSTIHTNSAAATITRLIEMGAKDYLISSTISGVVAQRLVKKLCPNCKEEYYPTYEEAKQILTDPAEIQRLTQTKIYRPKGCPNCKNTGYLGRLAVLEILVVDNTIKKLIAQRAHDVEIEDYAVRQGMSTLRMSCLKHILEGNTSIDEQVRILGLASEQ